MKFPPGMKFPHKRIASFFLLFAILLLSGCGIPTNPFLVDPLVPYTGVSSDTWVRFSFDSTTAHEVDGISLYYTYSSKDLTIDDNKEADAVAEALNHRLKNQDVSVSDVEYAVTAFTSQPLIDAGADNTVPSVLINDVLSATAVTELFAQIDYDLDSQYELVISFFEDNNFDNESLVSGWAGGGGGDSEGLLRTFEGSGSYSEEMPLAESELTYYGITSDPYYLYLFGAYYARVPDDSVQYSNTIADTDVVYLGRVRISSN